MNAPVKVSRRELLAWGITASGLTLGITLPASAQKAQKPKPKPVVRFQPNAFLQVASDGSVTVFIPRAEVGQSVRHALAMLLAEELEADWNSIRVQQAPVRPEFGSQETIGSLSMRTLWEPFRQAGAVAREMLTRAAALKWKVGLDTCKARNGIVTHTPTGKKLTYGQLAQEASTLAAMEAVTLKTPAEFRLIGKSLRRRDTLSKVDGTAVYGFDFRVPGMLFAVMARCPVPGGTLDKFDAEKAKKVKGVQAVLALPDSVAVVADTTWHALQGRNALGATWKEGDGAKENSDDLRTALTDAASQPGRVQTETGTIPTETNLKLVEATYELPFQAHAPMEPPNCTVRIQKNRCDLWLSTQMPERILGVAHSTTLLPEEAIHIHLLLGGGSFGGDRTLLVREALQIAQKVGKPVKLVSTREDDLQHSDYRPASAHLLKAHLAADGLPEVWLHTVASTPAPTANGDVVKAELRGATERPYGIPNSRTSYVEVKANLPRGYWRSASHSYNAFAIESFIDELAVESKADSLAYRLQLLNRPGRTSIAGEEIETTRLKRVLEMAAQKAGWGQPLGERNGRGIACHAAFGSYCAQVAEVAVDGDGNVKVKRVVCAIDCGQVVHPDTVIAQMEGGIAFGLTAALKGAITVENGQVMQANFHNYAPLHIEEMPQVEVIILPSKEAPGGVGEVGVPPIAPALCNALFAATGKRIRRLPVRTRELRQR